MRIDAHQHFWQYSLNPSDFPWMTDDLAALQRDFMPQDLAPLRVEAGVDASVAVQARELDVETDFLLGLATQVDSILGVVGWIDVCADDIEVQLDQRAAAAALKGYRMLIHDRADPDFADSAPHARGVGCLASRGLTYDLLLRTAHLPSAIRLVDRFPDQPFVVDHIAKPCMDGSDLDAWTRGMRAIAERPNVFCKLSGIVTEADWQTWRAPTFAPYLDIVLEAFGAERSMIGSDWPVCTLAADYARTMAVVTDRVSTLSDDERASILGGSCARFYSLG